MIHTLALIALLYVVIGVLIQSARLAYYYKMTSQHGRDLFHEYVASKPLRTLFEVIRDILIAPFCVALVLVRLVFGFIADTAHDVLLRVGWN